MDPKDSEKDEAKAEAGEPEAGEPEASEPEASNAEASEPEASEPDASNAEASEPEAERAEEKPEEHAPSPLPKSLPIKGAKWGEPIAIFEQRWTWLEARLLTFVLMAQILVLVSWVLLSGISSPPGSGDASGLVFRCALAAILFGGAGWALSRKRPENQRQLIAIAGILAGVFLGLILRPSADATSGLRLAFHRALGFDRLDAAIVGYFGNIKSWLQDGSTLTLMGGLRGVATRLTLWLALLGGSLATAAGKHIHIDVIFRFLPKRFRIPAAIVNFSAAAAVCFAATWGFFDHIAIESYGSKADDTSGSKISRVAHEMGKHGFLARKQIGLDFRTLPRVLAGHRYDQWMTPVAWNEWVSDAGFEDHYKPEEVKSLHIAPGSANPPPFVVAPDGEAARGILVHDFSLVLPFGLLLIGIRFLLRAILTLSGHIPVDPDAAHKDDLQGHGGSSELHTNTTGGDAGKPSGAAASPVSADAKGAG
ncbi:MAG: TRAP transporter small permease subunit [Polyangiaceae bacterium]|nr:TRAP transporter small permease subunit [Polyangiaceae bacterium]